MGTFKHYVSLFFYRTPALAFVLSGRQWWRTIQTTVALWTFLIYKKIVPIGDAWSFKFIFKGQSFTLDLESAIDVTVLAEIYVLSEYAWQLPFTPQTILDLGAHWGDSTLYYSLIYPNATVMAVEPSADIFKRLVSQTAQRKNITCIQGAFAEATGTSELFVNKSSLGSSFIRRTKSDIGTQVATYQIEDLCKAAQVEKFDLIKFDIEGAEAALFKNPATRTFARAFIGEIHLDLMDVTLKQIHEYFRDFELYMHKINDTRYIIRAIERIV